jgi:hypothetical protein
LTFKEGITICKPSRVEPHADISFEPGFLIWFILEGEYSPRKIGEALGSKLTEEKTGEWFRALWRTAVVGREDMIGDGLDDGSLKKLVERLGAMSANLRKCPAESPNATIHSIRDNDTAGPGRLTTLTHETRSDAEAMRSTHQVTPAGNPNTIYRLQEVSRAGEHLDPSISSPTRNICSPGPTLDYGRASEFRLMAFISVMGKLENILGPYLFEGMKASRMRRHEEEMGRITYTDAVRLRLAFPTGKDFLLEVWLNSPTGNAISQVRSVADLRDMLGNYLFAAMETSNQRQEEKGTGTGVLVSKAVKASCPSAVDSDEDSKLEIMLSFAIGRQVYKEAFPIV